MHTSLDRVHSQAMRMTDLVENLLQLVRLEQNDDVSVDVVDLNELVTTVTRDVEATDAEREWTISLPADRIVVAGDSNRLTQLMVNLLANAWDHTPPGAPVSVRVTQQDENAFIYVLRFRRRNSDGNAVYNLRPVRQSGNRSSQELGRSRAWAGDFAGNSARARGRPTCVVRLDWGHIPGEAASKTPAQLSSGPHGSQPLPLRVLITAIFGGRTRATTDADVSASHSRSVSTAARVTDMSALLLLRGGAGAMCYSQSSCYQADASSSDPDEADAVVSRLWTRSVTAIVV